jgi:hypothetical protein
MIAVLLLDARRGRGIVWAYVVAWVGAITVVLTALLAGFGAILEAGSQERYDSGIGGGADPRPRPAGSDPR